MEQNNNVEAKNLGGRPGVAESQDHFDQAFELYLQGVVSGSEIGRRLGLSAQSGVDLVKKVRASLQIADKDDDVSVRINVAHRRAHRLMFAAWENYRIAADNKERDAAIKTIREISAYLFEIQGLRSIIGG